MGSVNTMGLSPAELGEINSQQIRRENNFINLLGTAANIKRNEALNKQTEAQTVQLEPVEIEFGGKKFQTTKGSMVNAMGTLQQIQASQTNEQAQKAQTSRTDYDNEPMQISINGQMFNLRRHEFKDMSQILAQQEQLDIAGKTSGRAEKDQALKLDAIRQLESGAEVNPEIISKLGGLPGTPSGAGGKEERDRLQQVRKDWNQIFVQLNKKPESGGKNPRALANSANEMAEELGESIAAVVFPESYGIPGWGTSAAGGKDIPAGMHKMELRNPQTGALMSIGEVRQQALVDGMNLNDALMILHINDRLRGLK